MSPDKSLYLWILRLDFLGYSTELGQLRAITSDKLNQEIVFQIDEPGFILKLSP